VTFELQGIASLERLIRRYDAAPQIVREELEAGVGRATEEVQRQIRVRTPVRTGHLRDSLHVGLRRTGPDEIEGRVILSPHVSYFESVNYGHRAYTVEAKRAKALRFTVGGKVYFRRRVRIPATQGVHMVEEGVQAAEPTVRRIFSARLGNVTKRLASG
jgi:hypothetical protein